MTDTVSIIVPVYKTEQYLNRCVMSLVGQEYSNIEIVLVDDGSPDNCPAMCDEWAQKDSRIVVIHKKNEGLGFARNAGISIAQGDYICFCDSDDYLDTNAIKMLMSKAKEYKPDIVLFGFILENTDGKVAGHVKAKNEFFYGTKEIISNDFIPGMLGMNPVTGESVGLYASVCGTMFSKRLIQKTGWRCRSEREIIAEDYISLMDLYGKVDKALVVTETPYHYVYNPRSLSHSYKEDRYDRVKAFYHECQVVAKRNKMIPIVEQELCQQLLFNTIAIIKQIMQADLSNAEKYKRIRTIITDQEMVVTLERTKHDNYGLPKKALFGLMRYRFVIAVMLLCFIKTHKHNEW